MKKAFLMAVLAIAGSATALGQATLADARGKIGEAIESPKAMTEIMKDLSAEDQKQFLADVNKAIADLPASVEEKSAKYLNANHAAISAAQKGNTTALLAVTFATVSPDALTVINERFATDLVNRAADPKTTYTDEQFTKIAIDAMNVINERTAEADNASTRSAFAILMFVRASNGTPEDLADKLIDTLKNEEARELAKNEWIPAALGQNGREKSYEPILASSDAGRRPDFQHVLIIAGPQHLDSVLADISGKNTDSVAPIRTRTPVLDAVENNLIHQIPTLDGDLFAADLPTPPVDQTPHPGPYPWQN